MQMLLRKTFIACSTVLLLGACTESTETPEIRASSGTISEVPTDSFPSNAADKTSASGSYTGGLVDGLYEGKGVLIKPNKDRYEGTFKAGMMEGLGLLLAANGDSYEGEFAANLFSGKGRWESRTGDVYSGQFKKGMLNGEGTISQLSGNSYSGNVVNDRADGRGTFTYANGDVYVGQFKAGLLHGAGTLSLKEPRLGGRYDGKNSAANDGRNDGATLIEGEWEYGRYIEGDKGKSLVVENFIYDQPKLLQAQIDGLKPRTPNQANMYFLGVAGDGGMEVFRREVQTVEKQFAQSFSTAGRSIMLANTADFATDFPMANQISLQRALDAMAKQMDKQNDILFLFMTSHGSAEHEFALKHPYAAITDLPAKKLATMLDTTGIRHKVIVVSACFSGGFIKPLENDHHLILTAARRDRSSFGCATENNFTYFGRAFFNDALPNATSFQDAFVRAKNSISEWEARDLALNKKNKEYLEARRKRLNVPTPEVKPVAKIAASVAEAASAVARAVRSVSSGDAADGDDNDGEDKPSLPQIYEGKKIAPVLDSWWKLNKAAAVVK